MEKKSSLSISENCYLIIDKIFDYFNVELLELDILENNGFKIDVMYSTNFGNGLEEWSLPKSVDNFVSEMKNLNEYHLLNNTNLKVKLKLKVLKIDETNSFKTYDISNPLFNVSEIKLSLEIGDLKYAGDSIIEHIKVEEYIDVINKFPLFNLHNNQHISINRWLEECVSVNNRLGHQAIYFKTTFNDTLETLNSVKTRDVVSCKKIMFLSPDNELPSDRTIFSEWEIPMMDEFIIHIPDLLFKLIFGDTLPEVKDYLYIPILNKIYSINSVQPGIKFMGQVGWWECYLVKYEDDKTIDKSKIMDSIQNVINIIPNIDKSDISEIYEHFENTLNDGIQDSETILTNTIEEKKEVTDNFSNNVIDSVNFISLKETESQREFYNKRLEIVTLNPDLNTFPINFYNFNKVDDKVIGLTYNLIESTKINKFNRKINKGSKFGLSFNFILQKRMNGLIFDILFNNTNIFVSIGIKGKSFKINFDTEEYIIDFKFVDNNFYQINIDEKSINIFEIFNNEKQLVSQVFYNYIIPKEIELQKVNLFGGNYLLGDFKLTIDNKLIVSDKTKPILKMNNFGTL